MSREDSNVSTNSQRNDELYIRNISGVCLATLAVFALLIFAFPAAVPDWKTVLLQTVTCGYVFIFLPAVVRFASRPAIRMTMVMSVVLLFFEYAFRLAGELQDVFVRGWNDDLLLSIEHALIGTEVSVYMQRFVNPMLTEIMMFGYVAYVPLLPAVGFECYRRGGSKSAYEYLFALSLTFSLCYFGFILFPVASQMYHDPSQYTVPLEGGLFTWCSEWIRQNSHFPGGSLPSPHCAAGTVMLGFLYRHSRKMFRAILPVVLILYVSTVYGRFHYVWDMAAGIALGATLLKYYPILLSFMLQTAMRGQRLLKVPAARGTSNETGGWR
jgi:membrane-associated phospholipid phosphatase